jgi:hypothetical protein
MKRTLRLTSKARTFEQQTNDIAWQVNIYAELLHRYGRWIQTITSQNNTPQNISIQHGLVGGIKRQDLDGPRYVPKNTSMTL